MRLPLADKINRGVKAYVMPLASPTGGWNAFNNLGAMPPSDAIVMDNLMPEETGVKLRGGDELFASGMSGAVETLEEYVSPTTNELLAASDGNIYEISTGTPTLEGSGFTNAQWQTVNFQSYMYWANGEDTVQQYTGGTLGNSTFTGPTLTDIINVSLVFNRVWFVEKDSSVAWYGGAANVSGAMTSFDVGEYARSGYLVQVASWSRDSGLGMDDFTVFIMSTGQILVYSGDITSTVSLVGKYNSPAPIGRRCTINLGGELVILTTSGYLTMTNIMQGKITATDAVSWKIRDAVANAVSVGSSFDGWSFEMSPDERELIVNVPTSAETFNQHVYNVVIQAWGRWLDRQTYSIGTLNDGLYGGFADGEVYRLETGTTDASRSGANIEGYCIQAYGGMENIAGAVSTTEKQCTVIEPFVRGDGVINCTFDVLTDFETKAITSNLNQLNPNALFWEDYDFVNWEDWEDPWGSQSEGVTSLNLSVGAIGKFFAVACDVDTDTTFEWFSTNLTLRPGGII